MKSIKVNEYSFRLIFLAGFMLLVSIWFAAGCSTGDFSRSQAVTAISEAANYKQPSVTSINIGALSNAYPRARQLSKDEKADEALPRAKEDFKNKQPQLIIAEQLGYIILHFENPQMRGSQMDMPTDLYAKDIGVWEFKARRTNRCGARSLERRQLERQRTGIAARRSGEPEITGIVDEDKITRKVEFTCRWKPNKSGQSLDPNSTAFAELPEDLKQILKNPKFNLFGTISQTVNFTQARKGVAYFKKYDDGWRMQNLTLF